MSASITLPTTITARRYEPTTPIMQTKQALTILSALAQESRLAVYRLLIEHAPDGLAASAIAEKLGLANATLSFHLKELSHAGLVTSQQSGRFVYYTPVIEAMNDLIGYLTDHCCNQSDGSCGVAKTPCKPLIVANPRKRRTSSL
ncbi:metalloregulator ArsR/SmtB family transcription factor [Rhodanobacter caeni]|jgi:DNA-binding transcriptional ArsR family regulator|uniref:Metalloregulator ArsR/SmtB family transcription factor n=2 Tax=Rhodanobacter TaxID=75309 RepID=A0ABN0USB5_9GAMM